MANLDINGLPYMLVGDITVGTATTSVSFTGLTISKDDDYMLVSDFANPNATGYDTYISINNNTTLTNYYLQIIEVNGSATVFGARVNTNRLAYVDASRKSMATSNLKLTNSGYFVWHTGVLRFYDNPVIVMNKNYGTSTFTSTSITSLTITSSVASAIGIGSRFQLYKCVAEKVADITVATATTSVSISGLNIDKTGEYMLVSDFNNTSASASGLAVFMNSNTTATNYYEQQLFAGNTIVSGARENQSFMLYSPASNSKVIGYAKIKLTNSGYGEIQSDFIRGVGANAIELQSYYITSTFTATSITSLTLTASVSNAIGIGSRFQLYKMK